ncbi:MAG: hypothetical protein PHP50_00780 [Lachnospiraceae bacterium]|nr:hypothetical protein [Lachnospiraceae bacterium]
MNNKRRTDFGVNTGSASLLMIFVVLCLVSFAALSIVSANADYKLNQKVADRTTAYYSACNETETAIADIDKTLKTTYETVSTRHEYFDLVGHDIHYAIPISDLQTLKITLNVLYPSAPDQPFYEITSWEVKTTGDLEYDSSLPVPK